MSTLDPFLNSADGIGEPYKHAHAVNPVDLIMGDVELPVVSSALLVHDADRLRVTLLGGSVVTLRLTSGTHLLPIRVTKINHQEHYEGLQPYDGMLPASIIALW